MTLDSLCDTNNFVQFSKRKKYFAQVTESAQCDMGNRVGIKHECVKVLQA